MANTDNANSNPSPAPGAGDETKAETGSLIQVVFPNAASIVFFSALVLGVLLIVLSTAFRLSVGIDGTQANLLLCVGIALVISAFGGQATVRVGGIVMAGAAAVMIGVFLLLQNETRDRAVTGTISSFDKTRFDGIEMSNSFPILGAIKVNARHPERSTFQFVLFQNQLRASRIGIAIIPKDDSLGEIDVSIARDKIMTAFGASRQLAWELREVPSDAGKIFRIYDADIKGYIDEDEIASIEPAEPVKFAGLIGSAEAEEAAATAADIAAYLDRLTDSDASIRRSAREALGEIVTPQTVPMLMKRWRDNASDYRVRLGISVALTQMLRRDKSLGTAVSGTLTDADRNLLLDAAGDSDRTLRIYATEFLFDLGDPAVAKIALNRALSSTDDTATYNWVFASQDGWQKLSAADKVLLKDSLAKITTGAKTQQLIQQLK